MNKNDKKEIILSEGKDFTITSLASHLNEVFGCKKSGKRFNAQDTQQYALHGNLPKYLGGNRIISIKNKSGFKIYRVLGNLINKRYVV